MKRIFAYAAMAALAVGMSYPASAQYSGYTLYIYFYSDAAKQIQVGYASPHCELMDYGMNAGAQMQWGYVGAYRTEVQGPLCIDGEIQW
jgi:hypothetical protein